MISENASQNERAASPTALALSGGGLRAALFQQGCFLALALRGELAGIKLVLAISGGTLAALALRQAFAEVGSEWKDRSVASEEGSLQYQLSIADRASEIIDRCAKRDFRTRAVLSRKTVVDALLQRRLNITERFADEINRIFDRSTVPVVEPFALRVGLHDIVERKLISKTVSSDTNIGRLAAAAMALPGLMDGVILEEGENPVCDGGIDDKIGLSLTAPVERRAHRVMILDASMEVTFDPKRSVSPRTSLHVTIEQKAESLRSAELDETDEPREWISLRDAQSVAHNIDQQCLSFIKQTRTDLNFFLPEERFSLIALGFMLTLQSRGESHANIKDRMTTLMTRQVFIGGKERRYAMAPQFADVCGALSGGNSLETPRSSGGSIVTTLMTSWTLWSPTASLRVSLERSRRMEFQNAFSNHPFYIAQGLTRFTMMLALVVNALTIVYAIPITFLHLAAQNLGLLTVQTVAVTWATCGLVFIATGFRGWGIGECPSIIRPILGICLLPLLVPLVFIARVSVIFVQESEGFMPLKYHPCGIGKILALCDLRAAYRYAGRRPVLAVVGHLSLLAFVLINPFYFFNPFSTSDMAIWGRFGDALVSSPVQPITIAVLALELVLELTLAFCKMAKSTWRGAWYGFKNNAQ